MLISQDRSFLRPDPDNATLCQAGWSVLPTQTSKDC
jgi:hypothetical protein